jgi:drug/metabolite transporter (DMT)-like permease
MNKGIYFMLVATFTFSIMNVSIKMIPAIPPIEIIFFRSIISLVISGVVLWWQKVPFFGVNKPLLILRGVVGAISLYLFFTLLQQIPLATASTLNYLTPIMATLLGAYFLREQVAKIQWLFFAISFAGVLVVQGFDVRVSYVHLAIGLAASFFMASAYNIVRKLKTTEHPMVIIFYFPLVTLPFASAGTYIQWVPPSSIDWLYLILVGILTQIAQYFMTKSYQIAEINQVTILNYLGLIYSLVFGYYIFDETFNTITYFGMGLVLLGVILNVALKFNKKPTRL